MSNFQKATKAKAKLRLAMFGTPGAGKTYSALAIATGLGSKIAVIDSERGSASKYSDKFEFDTVDLETKKIDEYIKYMNMANQAGYDVLIIDSLSHAWAELLEDVDKIARTRFNGNTWSAWSEGTPLQKRFINALLSLNCHVIATMRSKVEYVQEVGKNGKMKPVKVGLAPEQGKGIEYEFDMLMEISPEHFATITKDRSSKFQDQIIEKPGRKFGEELGKWLSDGVEVPPKTSQETPQSTKSPEPTQSTVEMVTEAQMKMFHALGKEVFGDDWKNQGTQMVKSFGKTSSRDLTKLEMSKCIDMLTQIKKEKSATKSNGKAEYEQLISLLSGIKTEPDYDTNKVKINVLLSKISNPKLVKQAESLVDTLLESFGTEPFYSDEEDTTLFEEEFR